MNSCNLPHADADKSVVAQRYLACECGTVLALAPPPASTDVSGAGVGAKGSGRGRGDRAGGDQDNLWHSAWAGVARGAERRAIQVVVALHLSSILLLSIFQFIH